MGSAGRVRIVAGAIGRRQEELEAGAVGGRCAVAGIHVATGDPACAGGDADLIGAAVVADHRAHGVGAVIIVVAGLGRIRRTARVGAADGVEPVVVVCGRRAVPSRVLADQRRMIPVVAGVLTGNEYILAGEAHRPDRGRVDPGDARLDGQDLLHSRGKLADRMRHRQVRIEFDGRHVCARRQLPGECGIDIECDEVGDPK